MDSIKSALRSIGISSEDYLTNDQAGSAAAEGFTSDGTPII